MGYVEGANASNLQCLEYLSQDKCLSSLHKGLCSNPCVQVSVYNGSQWALSVAMVVHVYVYEGDPCIWMASSPLIWPKRGNGYVHFRFWSNGVGNCEA